MEMVRKGSFKEITESDFDRKYDSLRGVVYVIKPKISDREVEDYLSADIIREDVVTKYHILKPYNESIIKKYRDIYVPGFNLTLPSPELAPDLYEEKEKTDSKYTIKGVPRFKFDSKSELENVIFALVNMRETPWNEATYNSLETMMQDNRNLRVKDPERHSKLAQYVKEKYIRYYLDQAKKQEEDEDHITSDILNAIRAATKSISGNPNLTAIFLTTGINPYKEIKRIERKLGKKIDLLLEEREKKIEEINLLYRYSHGEIEYPWKKGV